MTKTTSNSENPVIEAPAPADHHPMSNRDWWPNQPNLGVLHQRLPQSSPLPEDFAYAEAFRSLDLEALKRDVMAVMRDSQPWWPADYGTYAPLFVRMTWHAAGTYRIHDGRGGGGAGAQRFAPLNSWPDNANLDKARRLLWPIKRRYGRALSWADLLMFAGNCAYEAMGFTTLGFGFGREDIWEPEEIFWGPEDTWLGDQRYSGDRQLAGPLGAVQMGLIYVNPEGPNGNPDPVAAARDIRETFRRMAMNDAETVALIVGGHTVGKTHGGTPADRIGPEPEGAPLEQQGLGWRNGYGTGVGDDAVTGGPEGAWTSHPTIWDNGFLDNLFGYEWELTASPAGAKQWKPVGSTGEGTVPDAHDPTRSHQPMMLTTDLALRMDPVYEPIARRFHQHPEQLADAFAKAWYKLLHRDMGPVERYLGPWVPAPQLWQDPVPPIEHPLVGEAEVAQLRARLRDSGLSVAQLVRTAWGAAACFRSTDRRGGVNGGRIRLEPQRQWAVNDPPELARVLDVLTTIQQEFNAAHAGGVQISLADLIVLGGCTAIERAAQDAGHSVTVPFAPGRTDASQEQTDVDSFAVLEPISDGFRNFHAAGQPLSPETQLVERARFLALTAPEMTVLVGGMRALGATTGGTPHGVLTERPGTLTNDFFVNLLDMSTRWARSGDNRFEGRDRESGSIRWTATAADLIFGANSQLRALAEYYASDDAGETFVSDFVGAWTKVMNLDRSSRV